MTMLKMGLRSRAEAEEFASKIKHPEDQIIRYKVKGYGTMVPIASRIAKSEMTRLGMPWVGPVEFPCCDIKNEVIDLFTEHFGDGTLDRKYEMALKRMFKTKNKRELMLRAWKAKTFPIECPRCGKVYIWDTRKQKVLRRVSSIERKASLTARHLYDLYALEYVTSTVDMRNSPMLDDAAVYEAEAMFKKQKKLVWDNLCGDGLVAIVLEGLFCLDEHATTDDGEWKYKKDMNDIRDYFTDILKKAGQLRMFRGTLSDAKSLVGGTSQALKMSLDAFKRIPWESGYGGQAWAYITKQVAKLITSGPKSMIMIDNVIDLAHNTSSWINKFPEYTELFNALNVKRRARSVREFQGELSPKVAKLVGRLTMGEKPSKPGRRTIQDQQELLTDVSEYISSLFGGNVSSDGNYMMETELNYNQVASFLRSMKRLKMYIIKRSRSSVRSGGAVSSTHDNEAVYKIAYGENSFIIMFYPNHVDEMTANNINIGISNYGHKVSMAGLNKSIDDVMKWVERMF